MSSGELIVFGQRVSCLRFLMGKDGNMFFTQGRQVLKSRYEDDKFPLTFFEEKGVIIDYRPTTYSTLPDNPEGIRFPSMVRKKLKTGEEITFDFVQMPFSPRNLLAMLLVPDENLKELWNKKNDFIVAITPIEITNPEDYLYIYAVYNPGNQHYEVQRLNIDTRRTQDFLMNSNIPKIVCCYDSQDNLV